MALKEQAKWDSLFEEKIASIAQSLIALASAENNIDNALFDAFGLGPSERTKVASVLAKTVEILS